MRLLRLTGFVLLGLDALHPAARANMLHIRVNATHTTQLRAIWHPRAGVIGTSVDDQQRPLLNARDVRPPADSLRRWRDPLARDTINTSTPVEFVVDMNNGPVRIEVVNGDSVDVEVQLAPERGPLLRARGQTFIVDADGRTPTIQPRP